MTTNDDETIGARIKRFRGKLLTQRQLADTAGVSVEVVRKLEQNQRLTASVGSLHKIARALDVSLAKLLGKLDSLPSEDPNAGVVAIRRALTTVDDLVDEPVWEGEPLTIRDAERTLNYAWGAYWAGKYDELGALLPQALAQLRATVLDSQSTEQAAVRELLARGFWVTASTLVHLGQQDLAYIAVRQALQEAVKGADPLLAAVLRNSVSWHMLVQGRYEESVRVATKAATSVEPVGDVALPQLSVYGSLLITAATSAARNQEVAQAGDFLAESHEVAKRIGHDRQDYETPFGPSQVTMQTVDVLVVTDEFGAALAAAKQMPRVTGLPLAAQLRHLTDRAYAHAQLGQSEKALTALLTAERQGPDWIKYQTLPRLVVTELIEHDRRVQAPLRGLAQRLGVNAQ